tara:strand:+ start:600 stop:1211 length:612 start_codon:yes stop_codon:yes gene_type:complete
MRKGKPDWWEDAVSHLVEDPHIGGLVDRFRKESLQGKGDIFQTLVRSIVGQQISVIAADSVHARLEGLCGVITRESIATKTLEELTSCGLSKPKSEYILGIANSDLPLLPDAYEELGDDELIRHLVSFKGIGPWTAEMMLIFSLMRPDVLSLGDLGIVKGIQMLVPGARTNREMESVAEAWRPFRSAACWFLWRSLDPVPVEY